MGQLQITNNNSKISLFTTERVGITPTVENSSLALGGDLRSFVEVLTKKIIGQLRRI